jgi:hypothetical protein
MRDALAHAMANVDYIGVPRERWTEFFDRVSRLVVSRFVQVEIEIASPILGDQLETGGWVTLNGLSYESEEDTLYIYTEDSEGPIDHAIISPKDMYVQLGAYGLEQVVILGEGNYRQFVRLRQPLELQAAAGLSHVPPA